MYYHGTMFDLVQGLAVELFGTAMIFIMLELVWPSFVQNYQRQYESAQNEELLQLREEISELKSLLQQHLGVDDEVD